MVAPHESVAQALGRVGQRYTRNRAALVDVLAGAGGPLTIAEVLDASAGLPQSSVYRNLAVLEQAGAVRRVIGADELSRYELAEDLTEHHHHLVCLTCGTVADFTVSAGLEKAMAGAVAEVLEGTGFTAESHRLDLLGECRECAAQRAKTSAR